MDTAQASPSDDIRECCTAVSAEVYVPIFQLTSIVTHEKISGGGFSV